MGDRVLRMSRPVGPDDVVDVFASNAGKNCEIVIYDIDRDGCVVQIQLANPTQGIQDLMDVRRVDTPSGPHLLAVPFASNNSLRLQCIADAGQTGPFRVQYSFRWLV